MPATIFSGSKVKALKSTLSLNGGADVISSATDPTSVAVDAAIGSLLLNTTSGKLYKKLDAGSSTNWQEVGAGTGGKNYITKGSFDTASTSGWSLAASTLDATTKLPNQASGSWTAAAGTLSITTVGGGSQLSLLPYSLSLVSSAATTAGNMLVSDALALDLEAQSSIQTFSFFYKVASGSPTLAGNSTNSIAVAVYDVTNGAWIDPAGRYNVVQISGVAKCAGTFQVPSNCTSVRLAVYFPNASAGAITVYLDDFYLGPQVVQYGAPVTDWQAYTPTFTGFGTSTGIDVYWRRVGSDIQVRGSFTPGTTTATEARISLPSGLTTTTDSVENTIIGTYGRTATSTSHGGFIIKQNAVAYVKMSPATTFSGANDTAVSSANGNAVSGGGGDRITFEFFTPILGWSSTVQMSNDTDTRVVAASYKKTSNQAVTGNVTDISFDTRNFDTHGAWSGSAYVAPVPGFYSLVGSMNITTVTSVNLAAFVNGTVRQIVGTIVSGNNVTIGGIVYLEAGQSLSIRSEVNITILGNSAALGPYLAIQRISGPSAIAASETVAASYWLSANQAVTAGVTNVNFDTREFDTHGAVTTGASWQFAAPIAGTYCIALTVETNGNTSFAAYKNGSIYKYLAVNPSANVTGGGSALIRLNAGDTINIRTNATVTVRGQATMPSLPSQIHIHRVGN